MNGLMDVCFVVWMVIFRVGVRVCSAAMLLAWYATLDSDCRNVLPQKMLIVLDVEEEAVGFTGRMSVSLAVCLIIITMSQIPNAFHALQILNVLSDLSHLCATIPTMLSVLNARRLETMERMCGLDQTVLTAACIRFHSIHGCVCHWSLDNQL